MDALDRMDRVHLWIGTTKKQEEEYLEYFELDFSTEGDFSDPSYKVCGFCEDLDIKWYEEDFIGIIPLYEEEVELDEILEEAAVDSDEIDNVKAICQSLGINKANAILWYADAEIEINNPKKSYNGLKYIGTFKGD